MPSGATATSLASNPAESTNSRRHSPAPAYTWITQGWGFPLVSCSVPFNATDSLSRVFNVPTRGSNRLVAFATLAASSTAVVSKSLECMRVSFQDGLKRSAPRGAARDIALLRQDRNRDDKADSRPSDCELGGRKIAPPRERHEWHRARWPLREATSSLALANDVGREHPGRARHKVAESRSRGVAESRSRGVAQPWSRGAVT